MSATTNPYGGGRLGPDDDTVKDLVRRSRQSTDAGFTRPSDNTLFAYLSGEATRSEIAEVQDALSRSSEFRREFLELANGFADLPVSVRGAKRENALQQFWTLLSTSVLRPVPALGYLAALVVAAVLLVRGGPTPPGSSVASNSAPASVVKLSGAAVLSGGEPPVALRPNDNVQFVLPLPSFDASRAFLFELSSGGETKLRTRFAPGELAASWDRNCNCIVLPMQIKSSAIPTGDVSISFGFEGDPDGPVKRDYRFVRPE